MVQLVDYTEPAVICVQLSKKLFENPLGRHAVREREREREREGERGAKNGGRRECLFSFNAILISIKLSSCSNNVSTRSQVSSYMVTSCGAGKVEGAGKLNSAAASGRKVRRYGAAASASNWRWLKFHGEEPPPSLSPWSTCRVGKADPRILRSAFRKYDYITSNVSISILEECTLLRM